MREWWVSVCTPRVSHVLAKRLDCLCYIDSIQVNVLATHHGASVGSGVGTPKSSLMCRLSSGVILTLGVDTTLALSRFSAFTVSYSHLTLPTQTLV